MKKAAKQDAPEFTLSDLAALTFRPAGSDTSLSVADATPQEFDAYIRRQVSGLRNVNPEWPPEHRLHILNQMYAECRDSFQVFPFAGCHKKERSKRRAKRNS